ncbi:cilia- and flagella-associated protein 251-like [Silurus meridionalis]|uniref:cilia- and flagella-associated protein 251-like n=1 Tax=Silurus meridionalis TaxID=175797 RepID=UPI001EEB708A|nr:cilia- and flagella-associated protein 251-like [Silurus meridionalis]
MKAESGEEEFESEEGEELAMEEEEQANEEEEFKSVEEEEQANEEEEFKSEEEEEQANEEEEFKSEEEEEQANKGEEKVQEGEQDNLAPSLRTRCESLTMAEAGLRVRPNLSRFTMATIIRAFRQHNRVERMPHRGGRVAIFTAGQETLIVDMVRENNLIRLREIRDEVIVDNVNFESIDDVSLATID